MKKIVDCIGNTPLIQCHSPNKNVEIFAKCEWFNPTGSVKDRAAFSITQSALQKRIFRK